MAYPLISLINFTLADATQRRGWATSDATLFLAPSILIDFREDAVCFVGAGSIMQKVCAFSEIDPLVQDGLRDLHTLLNEPNYTLVNDALLSLQGLPCRP